MATLIRGTVTLADGTVEQFVAGPRERIKAERGLKIKPSDVEAGNVGEEYIVFLVFESLKRDGKFTDCSFDDFIDKHLGDYEVDTDPESAAPLA